MGSPHEHLWVPLPGLELYPHRICVCGAFWAPGGTRVGENSISISPTAAGDVVRWSGTQAAVQAGDLGMNTTSGRPSAFVGGSAQDLAVLSDITGGSSPLHDIWRLSLLHQGG